MEAESQRWEWGEEEAVLILVTPILTSKNCLKMNLNRLRFFNTLQPHKQLKEVRKILRSEVDRGGQEGGRKLSRSLDIVKRFASEARREERHCRTPPPVCLCGSPSNYHHHLVAVNNQGGEG